MVHTLNPGVTNLCVAGWRPRRHKAGPLGTQGQRHSLTPFIASLALAHACRIYKHTKGFWQYADLTSGSGYCCRRVVCQAEAALATYSLLTHRPSITSWFETCVQDIVRHLDSAPCLEMVFSDPTLRYGILSLTFPDPDIILTFFDIFP